LLLLGLVRVGDVPWWEGNQPRVGVRIRVRVRTSFNNFKKYFRNEHTHMT
jgi:hypothetical protein